jgi:hypothetical protein
MEHNDILSTTTSLLNTLISRVESKGASVSVSELITILSMISLLKSSGSAKASEIKVLSESKTDEALLYLGYLFGVRTLDVPFDFLKSGSQMNGWTGIGFKYVHHKTKAVHEIEIRYCGQNGCKRHVIAEKGKSATCSKCHRGGEAYTGEDNTYIENAWKATCSNGHHNHLDRSLLKIPFSVDVLCGCGQVVTSTKKSKGGVRFDNVN